MAINENVYGSKSTWITPSEHTQWSNNSFYVSYLEEFYPKFQIGCATDKDNGRLKDYLSAGNMTRNELIDDSPTWVYTGMSGQAIGFQYTTPLDFDAYEQVGTWIGDGSHGGLTGIMFQVQGAIGGWQGGGGSWSNFKGFDGYTVPSGESSKASIIQNVQGQYRFSPDINPDPTDMSNAVIVANQTERYALTGLSINQKVYQEDISTMFIVIDDSKLSQSGGYQYCYSYYEFNGCNNQPIVSFCPKNYVLEPYIRCAWATISENNPHAYITAPDGLPSLSGAIKLGEFTEEWVQDKLDGLATWLENYRQRQGQPYPNTIKLVVNGAYAKVYYRSNGDTFSANSTSSSNRNGLFSSLLNGSVLMNIGDGEEIIDYSYNQPSSLNSVASALPVMGQIYATSFGTQNVFPTYSNPSRYTNNSGYWWGNSTDNRSSCPIHMSIDGSTFDYLHYHIGDYQSGYSIRTFCVCDEITSTADVDGIIEKIHSAVARYGLFFCDDYNNLPTANSPSMWTDENMMCGTYTESNGIRITEGYYTSGMDNINQPQFKMIDSNGDTWSNHDVLQTENGAYPALPTWNIMPLDSPQPLDTVLTTDNAYPAFWYWAVYDIPVEPTPYCIFDTEEDYPQMPTWNRILIGAFANSEKLIATFVPNSTKSIGYNAYTTSKITNVTLANDCTYHRTSFPDDCVVVGGIIINEE